MGGGCRRAGTTATCFSLDDQEEEVEKIVHVTMAAPWLSSIANHFTAFRSPSHGALGMEPGTPAIGYQKLK